MNAPRSSHLALLGAGFGIWAAGFLAIYGLLSLGCASGWDSVHLGPFTLQRVVLAALALATLAAAALAMRFLNSHRHLRDQENPISEFLTTTAFYLTIASAGAIVFTFSGIVALSTCS